MKWPNIILTISNVFALYPIVVFFYSRYYVGSILYLNACIASIFFHSCEQHKHPALHGIYKCSEKTESKFLNYDRVSALMVGLYMLSIYEFDVMVYNWWIWFCFILNFISELHYFGIVKNPKYDIYIYSILHSLWHICIFISILFL